MSINLSGAINLAIHALTYMANQASVIPISTGQIANAHSVSKDHLSKVFQRLVKSGLLISVRGPQGGYLLAQAPNMINLLRIYEAIEGPLTEVHCMLNKTVRDPFFCVFHDHLSKIEKQVVRFLSTTTLADLIRGKSPLS